MSEQAQAELDRAHSRAGKLRAFGLPLLALSSFSYLGYQMLYCLAPESLARPTPGIGFLPLGIFLAVVLVGIAIGCTATYIWLCNKLDSEQAQG